MLGQPRAESTLTKFKKASIEMWVNATCRHTTIAGSFRFFGGFAIAFFMPQYFFETYPDDRALFSTLNSILVAVCGLLSTLIGGIIADKYEKEGFYMTKAYVCIVCGALGIPTIAACLLV